MIFHALADPLVMGLIGLILAALLPAFGLRRLSLATLIASGLFIYLLATPLVSGRLLSALEADLMVEGSNSGPAPQAIVVLSADLRRFAPEFDGETVGDLTLERMRFGATMHRRSRLPMLVTGGHVSRARRPIARLMAEAYAEDYGIPVRWVEERARNTFENAAFSQALLDRDGITSIYLVTHAWHMPRALAAFEHVGLQARPAPTGFTRVGKGIGFSDLVPRSKDLTASSYAFHELIGRLWYEWALF